MSTTRRMHSMLTALPPLAVIAIAAAFLWFIFKLPPGPQFTAEAKECDRQVATLLTTHDAVELQRAMFLLRRLNCDLGNKLPQ